MKKEKVFFPNLDSLRFIAFLLVFLQHGFYNFFKNFEGKSYLTDRFITLLFVNGGTGVQIFFVLSGFLITYLILKEVDDTKKLNLKYFYLRRTLRIWPLYFATVLFAFLVYPTLKSILGIDSNLCSRPQYYFTFLANFDVISIAKYCPGKDAMTQAIVWSVSIEEQFYLFWPLLFFFIPSRRYWIIFPVIILTSICFKILHSSDREVLYFHTLSVISDLAIGGLFAFLQLNSRSFKNFIENQKKGLIQIIYIAIVFFIFFGYLLLQFNGGEIAGRLIGDLCWGYIIIEQNFAKNSFYQLRSLKSFTNWGKYTYGLYMLHPVGILIADVIKKVIDFPINEQVILFFKGVLSYFLSLLIAFSSYRLLELPFLRLKERFTIIKNKPLRAAA